MPYLHVSENKFYGRDVFLFVDNGTLSNELSIKGSIIDVFRIL